MRLPVAAGAIAGALALGAIGSEPSGIPLTAAVIAVNAVCVVATAALALAARAGRVPLAWAAPLAVAAWATLPLCTFLSMEASGDPRLTIAFIMELMAAPTVILVGRWLAAGVAASALAGLAIELHVHDGRLGPLAAFVGGALVLTAIGHVVNARAVVRADAARAETAAAARRLLAAQRLEAVGTLAAGLAHDMNNILGGITGAAESLRAADPADAPLVVRQIIDEAERGGVLTRSLLAFSRRGHYRHEPVDLAAAVEQVVAVLRRTVSKAITVRAEHGRRDLIVDGDPAQLQQAVFNLALNGVQAIGEAGTVTISTAAEPADGVAAAGAAVAGELRAVIEVRDTGAGMDEATRSRIFEPFFTTRAPGGGSGLGLAMVWGTVEAHRGTIEVESAPGQGTTMRVRLPARAPAAPSTASGPATEVPAPALVVAPAPAAASTPPPAVASAPLHVLLVDDEPLIRQMYERALVRAGMSVTCAVHGGDALARFEAAAATIDAVVLDMAMPVVSGAEVFRRLRERRPGLPIVIASGYTVDAEARALLATGHASFLEKPFRNETLVAAVRELTAAGARAGAAR